MAKRPLILFDFGGTLNSDGDHWGALFRAMWQRVAPEKSVDEIESAYIFAERTISSRGLRNETFDETLALQLDLQKEALQCERVDLTDELTGFSAVARHRITLFSDLIDTMTGIAAVGVVSNFYGNIPAVCSDYGIDDRLTIMVDSALVKVRKPDPAIWTEAINRAGGEASRTIVVGDSHKNDIAPASGLGCRTIWCRGMEWRPFRGESLADIEVRGFKELESGVVSLLQSLR